MSYLVPLNWLLKKALNTPTLNLTIIEHDITHHLRRKNDDVIYTTHTKRIEASLAQFRRLVELVSKQPFAEARRLDDSIPLREAELFSTPIQKWGVYLLLYYICSAYEYVPDEHLHMTIANYESELFMSTTAIDIRYERDAGEIVITVDKKGFVHEANYGFLFRFFFNTEFYKEQFLNNADETVQHIVSLVRDQHD